MSAQRVNSCGAVFVEGVLSLTLMFILIMGFAQEFWERLVLVEQMNYATQLQFGPQERSLSFDVSAGTFSVLSSSTTPTQQEFMDTLGNHFLTVRNDDSVLIGTMMYVTIDPDTGLSTGVGGNSNPVYYVYPSNAPAECNNAGFKARTTGYGTTYISRLQDYRNPTGNVQVPIGTKLFDIVTGGATYKGYVDYIPMAFFYICKPEVNVIYKQVIGRVFAIHPRRLLN